MPEAPAGTIGTVSEEVWERVQRFLEELVPVAETAGVRLAMHPADPPLRTLRGTARLVYRPEHYQRLLDLVPSHYNAAEFCQGTIAEMDGDMDVYEAIETYTAQGKMLLTGRILLTFANRLAVILIRDDHPRQIGLGPDWPRSLFQCCVRVAGVVVVVQGIPKVITQLTHYGFLRSHSLIMPIPTDIWADGLAAVVYVALGVYLVKGGPFFLKLAEGSTGTSAT